MTTNSCFWGFFFQCFHNWHIPRMHSSLPMKWPPTLTDYNLETIYPFTSKLCTMKSDRDHVCPTLNSFFTASCKQQIINTTDNIPAARNSFQCCQAKTKLNIVEQTPLTQLNLVQYTVKEIQSGLCPLSHQYACCYFRQRGKMLTPLSLS